MGQYYNPVELESKEWLNSHDYDNGLKLMEHSWIGNNFVNEIETLLIKGGAWHKKQLVWAGDYADGEKGGDNSENIFSMCKDELKVNPNSEMLSPDYRYLVNHDRKEYVDKNEVPVDESWRIHPLPLLTCEGNGRGGGDYRNGGEGIIGRWSRNRISVAKTFPKGFERVDVSTLTE